MIAQNGLATKPSQVGKLLLQSLRQKLQGGHPKLNELRSQASQLPVEGVEACQLMLGQGGVALAQGPAVAQEQVQHLGLQLEGQAVQQTPAVLGPGKNQVCVAGGKGGHRKERKVLGRPYLAAPAQQGAVQGTPQAGMLLQHQ